MPREDGSPVATRFIYQTAKPQTVSGRRWDGGQVVEGLRIERLVVETSLPRPKPNRGITATQWFRLALEHDYRIVERCWGTWRDRRFQKDGEAR